MSGNIVNNFASTIVTIYKDVVEKFEDNLKVIKQSEDELNDLYHEIELANPKDMYKGYLVYKEIREVRIRRRTAKEENELLKDMYDYFMSQNGQTFKSKIQSIQGNSVKIRNAQEQRIYQPRQRSDLTITDKHVVANKPFEEMLSEFNKNKPYMSGGKMRR
jgi:hypothetical protein